MSALRIPGKGRVDHAQPVRFTFDGKSYQGLAGDTLASALLANGVHLVGRSFKYHRPRGVVSAGSEEPNALVGVSRGSGREEPNTRATMQEVYDGLAAVSQNRWPCLHFDAGAGADVLHRLLPAGFYYKTFLWPKRFWDRVYEPLIRRAAGLGVAPSEPDADSYASRYAHCDVLVVGGGPAGIAAALAAARSGARVILADEQAEIGGSLLAETGARIDGQPAWDWLAAARAELEGMANVRLLPRTTAIGYYHQNMVGLAERVTDHLAAPPQHAPRERMWRVRAGQVVLAQGAIERPLVFHGNDRPGVMLAGAARTYLHRYGVKVGERAVVVTSHDSAWQTAFDLADAGVSVAAIADVRAEVDSALLAGAQQRGIEILLGHTVTGTSGRLRINAVTLAAAELVATAAGRVLRCDVLLMSGGWTPSLHLFSHTQGRLAWDEASQSFLPGERTEDCHIAGAGRGLWGLGAALADGAAMGAAAARAAGFSPDMSAPTVEGDPAGSGVTTTELPGNRAAHNTRAFVDFQNDVTAKDIRLAVHEGMRSIEHVKRYTTTGMATDQGKLAGMNALAIAAETLGAPLPAVGLTTFRPPYTPTTFGAFAGYHQGETFDVTRKTPIDPWAEASGAVFEPVSLWRRARYFPKPGEDMHAAVARECRATRSAVGMMDASTLGKIEVVGPDAAEFLNRMYTNPFTRLGVGRCRYGVLLGEDGFIRDDGVIGRLAADRFHVTTTTGGAPRVLNMMEDYLQTEWPDLRVWLTSTTEQWVTVALNGPNARRLLEPLVEGQALTDEAFPHMSVSECRVAGFSARLFRVSFTGEMGFEVNVPARHGLELWELLAAAGQEHGLCVYGTEAMHVLRAEKGFIIVGQDSDGTVTPDDAGLGWAIGRRKSDFVGKRSLARPDLVARNRKQLVGLVTHDPRTVLEEGAQIVEDPNQPLPMTMIGHVTSSYWSEALGRSIALALVEGGRMRMGDMLYLPMPEGTHSARVTGTVFYDPQGERLSA